jgi:hypothetical protein
MKTFIALASLGAVAALSIPTAFAETTQSVGVAGETVAATKLKAGQMLYSSAGYRVAQIYRVSGDGNPQVIYDGKLITVPASTISAVDGKVTTTLTKRDLSSAK